MTAQEARERTDTRIIVAQNFELMGIISKIADRVNNGYFYLNMFTPRYWEVNKSKITDLGYKVENINGAIQISWE